MIAYPDTSFLFALYRLQVNSSRAAAHIVTLSEPLHVTSLLLFKLRQSLHLQEFLHKSNPRLGFDRVTGRTSVAKLQTNLASGALILVHPVWEDVIQLAGRLSTQHTFLEGYRSFDILHVATALHFGAREFLTFDRCQGKLARAEGLRTPL